MPTPSYGPLPVKATDDLKNVPHTVDEPSRSQLEKDARHNQRSAGHVQAASISSTVAISTCWPYRPW